MAQAIKTCAYRRAARCRRGSLARATLPPQRRGGQQVDELGEVGDACTIGVAVAVQWIEQHRRDAGVARAAYVDLVDVSDVDGLSRLSTTGAQRNVEDLGVRLFHANEVR